MSTKLSFSLLMAALFFSSNSPANELIGSRAPVLTSNQVDAASKAYLNKRCTEDAGLMTIPNRTTCHEILDPIKLSQGVFDHCKDRNENLSHFVDCVEAAQGRDYPMTYLEVCREARQVGRLNREACFEYFANSASTYDIEAAKFCLKGAIGSLANAKPCLNAIRDRQVDAQKLKQECIKDLSMSESFGDCVGRLTDRAPSTCSTSAGKGSSGGNESGSLTDR